MDVARRELKYGQRPVELKKAFKSPDFDASTVLVADPWDYVDLWLRRDKAHDARFYWEQARQFYNAAQSLPPTASPLPAYYCLLNASKALLASKNFSFKPRHGVTGWKVPRRKGLRAEKVKMVTGVLTALALYLGEPSEPRVMTLYEMLYNLPYIHRAFMLTFKSARELFIPIHNPRFVIKDRSTEAWFEAVVDGSVANGHTVAKLPAGYERDIGVENAFVIRKKQRFRWERSNAEDSLKRLSQYHHEVRRHVFYIYGPSRLWYLKRTAEGAQDFVNRSSMTLTYAAMHRLSELARYEPLELARHFDGQHNWLLTEFIQVAPRQFIDEIASELTGRDFMVPGIRKLS